MKRVLASIIVLVILTSLFGCGSTPANSNAASNTQKVDSSNAPTEIKIGVVAPISGQSAIGGKYIQNGIAIIQDKLDKDGGLDVQGKKVKIKILIEDGEAKPDITTNAYRKLIEQDKVIAIVGPDQSKDILAAGPIAQAAKIPAIGTYSTNEKVTQVGDFIFRACFIDPFQGKVMGQYARETLKAGTAAILYNNADQYCKGLQENFKKSFEELGGKVVAIESYGGADIKDFNAQLTKIKAGNPDVLYLPNQVGELPLQLKQARQMGITAKFLGGDSWDYETVPQVSGNDMVEGAEFTTSFSPDDPSAEAQEFVKSYQAKFSEKPSSSAVLAYEAMAIVLKGIQDAKTLDGQGVRDAMAALKDFKVPSGSITFDESRNPIKGAVIMTYVNGEKKYVTTVNPK